MPIVAGQYSEPLVTVRRRAIRRAVASNLNEDFQLQVDHISLVESPQVHTNNDQTLGDVSLRVVFVPDADKNILCSHVSEMNKKMEQVECFLAALPGLNEKLDKMGKEIDKMGKENEGMKKENEGMKKEIEGMKKENEEMKKENKEMKKENKEMKKENKEMKQSIERLESDNKWLRERIERLQEANERLENENEKLEKIVTSITVELSGEKALRAEDMEYIRKLTLFLTPIHLRVLLDLTRQEILKSLGYESWEDLRGGRFVHELSVHICRILPRTLSSEAVDFVCVYTNIRREGNMAAHQATKTEMEEVIATRLPDSKERRCLEELFRFVFAENYDLD